MDDSIVNSLYCLALPSGVVCLKWGDHGSHEVFKEACIAREGMAEERKLSSLERPSTARKGQTGSLYKFAAQLRTDCTLVWLTRPSRRNAGLAS